MQAKDEENTWVTTSHKLSWEISLPVCIFQLFDQRNSVHLGNPGNERIHAHLQYDLEMDVEHGPSKQ